MASKRYRKGIGVFEDLHDISDKELDIRVDIIQRLITKKDRRERIEEMVSWRVSKEGEIRRLEKRYKKLEGYFKEMQKYKRIHNEEEFAENREEFLKIEAKMKEIKAEVEEAVELERQETEAGNNEKKWTSEEKKMLSDYTGFKITELVREGKRTFVYLVVREDFDQAYEIAHEYEIAEKLDNAQKRLEEYFQEFEKKKIISFSDKVKYKEMEKQYKRILAEKKRFHDGIREIRQERKEQGLDENALLLESDYKVKYYTDENNWDTIIDEVIKSQEPEAPKSNILKDIFNKPKVDKAGNYIPFSQRHKFLGKIFGGVMDPKAETKKEFYNDFINEYGEEPTKQEIFWGMHPRLEAALLKMRILKPVEVDFENKEKVGGVEVVKEDIEEGTEQEELKEVGNLNEEFQNEKEVREKTEEEHFEEIMEKEQKRKEAEEERLEEILKELADKRAKVKLKLAQEEMAAQEAGSPMGAKRQEFLQEYSLDSDNQSAPIVETSKDSDVKTADIPEINQSTRG